MEIYYTIVFFILGSVLGSFYNVVGYRLPKGESIVSPGSHCPNCKHELKPIELIPIFSFLFQGGKCKKCGLKISWFYPIFEFVTGILFSISYLKFGFSVDLIISLTFISMLLIIVISDYHYLIIPDEILIFFGIALVFEMFFKTNIVSIGFMILDGLISFGILLLLKLFGDWLFKKESMGGGDIKLMLILGFILGWQNIIILITLASFIGLPISIVMYLVKKDNVIPFGPFLSAAAMIIYFTGLNMEYILNILS